MTIKILLAPIYATGYVASNIVLYHKIMEERKNYFFFDKPRPLTERLIALSASAVYSVFWPFYTPFVITSMLDDAIYNTESTKKEKK